MTAETITLEGLAQLEVLLSEAVRTVQRAHLEASLGLITTDEAADMINQMMSTINGATK